MIHFQYSPLSGFWEVPLRREPDDRKEVRKDGNKSAEWRGAEGRGETAKGQNGLTGGSKPSA